MRRLFWALALMGLAGSSSARGDGLLVPTDRSIPPLSLRHERVNVTIDGQVATTSVEQVFQNNTPRDLEADYLFPLPAGAAVREFAMWVGGKRLTGETIDASRARRTYEDIVRRLKDPGLLEYVDRDLWKVRIFPVPRYGEQKIEIKFTTLLAKEADLISYQFPLRTGQAQRREPGYLSMVVNLRSEEPLGPIYSPTHDVAVNRKGEREAIVSFEISRYRPGPGSAEANPSWYSAREREFMLYFAPKSKEVGLSLLTQRDDRDSRGYFLLLLSPRANDEARPAPRDLVVVLDTSYSMKGEKLKQAKGALKAALDSLNDNDRFALIQFATVVTPFRDRLLEANRANLREARGWVEKLEAQGATDIGSALEEALALSRWDDGGRSFQVVFFTDGLPTAGSTVSQILEKAKPRVGSGTRVFTFGVGDDVDAHLLDQLAELSRASSTYVRPSEDLEAKASTLVSKISHPVRTDLRLRAGDDVRLVEMYPPQLPDLFRGEQLQVAGRYEGSGHVSLTLESRIGSQRLTDIYEVRFPERATDRDFIAPIWARRKVGYLLDQIRLHGESSEAKNEVIRLAREFGIATPYTSFLVVPDDRRFGFNREAVGGGGLGGGGLLPRYVHPETRSNFRFEDETRDANKPQSGLGGYPGLGAGAHTDRLPGSVVGERESGRFTLGNGGAARETSNGRRDTPRSSTPAAEGIPVRDGFLSLGHVAGISSSGTEAIDLAQKLAELKTNGRLDSLPLVQNAAGHPFRKVDDVWVDDRYESSAKTLKLKAFGSAYFRLLANHPELKTVFALGDRVVWVTPSGVALVIDTEGNDEVADQLLDSLFKPASDR
jgi:Ca-activated chloride channel homolog